MRHRSLEIQRSNTSKIFTDQARDRAIRINSNENLTTQSQEQPYWSRKPNKFLNVTAISQLYARDSTLEAAWLKNKWMGALLGYAPKTYAAIFTVVHQ